MKNTVKSSKSQTRRKFSLNECLYNMATIGLLLMVEVYLWVTKFNTIKIWIIELMPMWIGGLIGSIGTLYILFYYGRIRCKKKGTFKFKKFVIRTMTVCVGIFRVAEAILALTHLHEFLSWWSGGFLTYASIGWLVAIISVAFAFKLFSEISTPHNDNNVES